jgi:peptide chain release factor subunit 1
MITRHELRELLSQNPKSEDSVLSVYLNVDQSQSVNLNRGFEAAFRSLAQAHDRVAVNNGDRGSFQKAVQMVGNFLSDYRPNGKTLVLFCDPGRDFQWHRGISVPLESRLEFGIRPFVRPLFEVRDEYQRYGVCLTDRGRSRLLTVFLGSIQEKESAFAEADVRRFDGPGSDALRSQMNLRRKADEHARWHLKHVVERLEKISEAERFDRIVLGGTAEAVAELRSLLSERLRRMDVGSVSLAIDAPLSEIRDEVVDLQLRVEREGEQRLVEQLITAAAKNHEAVVGWHSTTTAAVEGRVRQLVYAGDAQLGGAVCSICGRLMISSEESCPNCGGDVSTVRDLTEFLVERVFLDGGEIEQVRGEAASALHGAGSGIGALLRF